MKVTITKAEFEAAVSAVNANNALVAAIDNLMGTKTASTKTIGWGEFLDKAAEKWGKNFTTDTADGEQVATFNIPAVVTVGLMGRTTVLLQQLNAIMPAIAGVVAMVKGMLKTHDADCDAIVRKTMTKPLAGPTSRVLNPKTDNSWSSI